MDAIKLVLPGPEHREAAEQYKQAFFDAGEGVINGSALLDQMNYTDWLEQVRQNQSPKTVRPDWVVASTFFAVREKDGRILGMLDLRHTLKQAFLSQYGGHIGYSVRPDERQKGYAAAMLQQAIIYAKQLGLSKVMLGCFADNLASIRTIEKCGGILTETKPYLDNRMMHVYWIFI